LAGYLLLADRLVADAGSAPSAVNFGPEPGAAVTVAKVVERVLTLWGAGRWEPVQEAQPQEAHALQLDIDLATTTLGWRPRLDLDTTLAWTVDWWRAAARHQDLRRLALDQIEAFEGLAR
ncbi:MAG: CDP-glucose 4,6-dehydratase, partial [Actinomycetota bacterium]|nr:CDP-glucose 4,6-dehydratase [Actinomycetota bacterium]